MIGVLQSTPAANEDSEAKPFWIAFFEIFGITDKRVATFELNVKKHGSGQGFVDLFWPCRGERRLQHLRIHTKPRPFGGLPDSHEAYSPDLRFNYEAQ